jgi:hypothetical protein
MFSIWIRCFPSTALFLVFSLVQPVRAQSTIQPYFDHLEGYQVEKLTESSTLQEDFDSPYSSQIIDEFVLFQYSRWAVRAVGPTIHSPLELEVYEMQDPQGAFGVFSNWNHRSLDSLPQRLNLSVDNYFINNSLIFWRGAYFFHLTAASQEPLGQVPLEPFARTLIDALPLLNLHPLTVIHLPQENVIQESIRFYLGEASFGLNSHFPRHLIPPLGFEHHIEITAARYSPENHNLYLIGYPTPGLAAQHSMKLQNAMEDYFSPEGVYMRRSGVIVSIFFGSESEAQEILPKIHYAPAIKWIYQKEVDPEELRRQTIGFLGSVQRTLTTILIFLPLALAAGLAAGLVRYSLFQRFPMVRKQGDTIHLDINSRRSG